jgi:transposase
MTYIQSYKDQVWLLPPSIEELIPEDHICFLVEALIDSMDFGAFDLKYAGSGHPAYHPRVLLKILVMGVMDRVRSSRRLAKNARENVVYMYLSEKLAPDFRTISDFRKDNPDVVKKAFSHTVELGKQEGLIDLSHLSTDGSKIKANASNRRVLTGEELDFLLRFVDEELEEWTRQDTKEDGIFGDLRGFDQLPGKSKKVIQKAAQYYISKLREKGSVFKEEIKDKLEKAFGESKESGSRQTSMTDPKSRFIKNGKGKIELSYNSQITVDNGGFILSSDVCQDVTDAKQLEPQVLQVEENVGSLPAGVAWSFDAGYFGGANIKFLSDKKIDGYIPENNKGNTNPYDKSHFRYDMESDEYLCPEKKRLKFLGEHFDKQKNKTLRVYMGEECVGCKVQSKCTRRKDGIRYIKDFPYEAQRNTMREKMKTPEAKEVYALRSRTVEPVFGDIKENKGLSSFLTRGLERVKIEFNLACIGSNLKKIEKFLKESDRKTPLPERSRYKSDKIGIKAEVQWCLVGLSVRFSSKHGLGIVGQPPCCGVLYSDERSVQDDR